MAYGDNPGKRTPAKKKPKKKIRAKAPSTTDRTSPNPASPPKPKKGPPSPQRTGRATRPQPITRKRDAPPTRTDTTSDAKRTPEQKRRDKAASDANIREARIKVLRKRNKALTERITVSSKGTIILKGSEGPKKVGKGYPGATANPTDDLGSALGPQINRLITKRSKPEDVKAPAMKALDLVSRPAYAVGSAAKAKIKYIKKHGYQPFDSGARKAAFKGAERGLSGKEKSLGSDVLKEAGVKNKAVAAVGGFVFDMAADPTRAAKITRLAPKTHLERAARSEEAAAAKAARPGRVHPARPKKAQRHADRAKKLRSKAEGASESPGIQIGSEGPRHRLMTSGRATAKVGKKGRRAAERVGDSRAGQIVKGAVMPTARRKGETQAERDAFVYAERKRRARMNEAGRKGQRRGTAHARNVRDVDEKKVIARVEDPETLASPAVKTVAAATSKELGELKVRQQQADVFSGERENYYPHQQAPKKGILRRKGRAASPGHAKRRKDDRPIHVQNAEREAIGKDPKFSTEHGKIMGSYVTGAERAIADADYLKDIKAAGKPLTAKSYEAMRDTDGLYRVTPTSIQPVRHPSGRELDPDEVAALIKKGEDVTILPKARADAEVAGRVGGKNEQTKATLRALNKPMQVFKTAATVLNVPYYQVRNFMDDSFHGYAAGTSPRAFAKSTGLVKDLAIKERREGRRLTPKDVEGTIDVAGKDMPRSQFIQEAIEDGAARTGFFAGDDLTTGSSKPATGARRIRPVQKAREWSQNIEDVPRLATYYAARDRGMTRKEASQHVRLYHFDYDELTDIERVVRATLVPFYTYARKNTPLMARLFFTQPGRLSTIEKLRQEFNKYGTDDERYRAQVDKLRPVLEQAVKAGLLTKAELAGLYKGKFDTLLTEADQRAFPFLGPDGSLQYMPLGVTDLNRIPFAFSWGQLSRLPKQQFDLAMQMIGPQKLPLEMAQNYSFFFRDAIYRSAKEPGAERWVTAPPWASKAGIPTVRQKVDGEMVDAWPAWVDYSIRSLGPQAGMVATVGNPAKTSRGATMGDMLLKQVTGVRRSKLDDRILAGIIERASKELGKVRLAKADAGDAPAVKTEDGFFFSKNYEGLLNKEKALTGLIESLRKARTGVKSEKPIRLQRRPLTPAQQLRKEFREDAEGMKNFGDELRRELERDAAKMRIENSGG